MNATKSNTSEVCKGIEINEGEDFNNNGNNTKNENNDNVKETNNQMNVKNIKRKNHSHNNEENKGFENNICVYLADSTKNKIV